jgi:hypothetical protein
MSISSVSDIFKTENISTSYTAAMHLLKSISIETMESRYREASKSAYSLTTNCLNSYFEILN